MIRLLLFALLCCTSFLCRGQDITLTTQSEVDALDPSITSISGFLHVRDGANAEDSIIDLSSLANLTTLSGDLIIQNTSGLLNLNDLSSLNTVGGSIIVQFNSLLADIDGMTSLGIVNNSIVIHQNDSLEGLDGFINLTSVGTDLIITENFHLSELNGMSNLNTIGGSFYLGSSEELISLRGLSSLETVGGSLSIEDNRVLNDLNGLSNLTTVGDSLHINNNSALSSLDGLLALESIGGNLTVTHNSDLPNLAGLAGLTSIGPNITISNNNALINISVFNTTASIDGNLIISNNESLLNIDGLSNLTTIGNNLNITRNTALNNIDGLSNLTTIGNDLNIVENRIINNIGGLSNLNSIGNDLNITQDSALLNLDGLSNLSSIGRDVILVDNIVLDNIVGLSNLTALRNLLIRNNSSLTSINGLQNIATIEEELNLFNNDSLENFNEFSSLTSVGIGIDINHNNALLNINGLSGLTNLGYLGILDNGSLINVDGLSGLDTIGDYIDITLNPALININGLSNVRFIGENIGIGDNASLANIDGLQGLTTTFDVCLSGNLLLENIDGLSNISFVNGSMLISANDALENVDGLSNIDSISGYLDIYENPSLSNCCAIQELLATPGRIGEIATIWDNPFECNSVIQVINSNCSDVHIFNDPNSDCLRDTFDFGLYEQRVKVEPGNLIYQSNRAGGINLEGLPIGNYTIEVDTSSVFWNTNCAIAHDFEVTITNDLPEIPSFGLTSTMPCDDPRVTLYMPFVRSCFEHQRIYIKAANGRNATGILEDAYVELTLDSLMNYQDASIEPILLDPYTYRIEIGDLNPGQQISLWVDVMISCDAVLGQSVCLGAEIYPISSCFYETLISAPIDPVSCTLPYDDSDLEVYGYCQNDSLHFVIDNVGNGDMSCYAPVRFYADAVLNRIDSVMLLADEQHQFDMDADGRTWRVEVDQHPDQLGLSRPNATIERCGDLENWTPGFVNALYLDDASPLVDIFCSEVTGSYDPNDKTGYPLGITEDHLILPDQPMEYRIRFQNTGTDTAFTVIIRDTLDMDFDIFSVTSGVASHPYEFRLYGPRVMEWTFHDILLPDSTTNEMGSHGFVTYQVKQKNALQNGTALTNSAGIYFDFNDPIITNITNHMVDDQIQSLVTSTSELRSSAIPYFDISPNPSSGRFSIDLYNPYRKINVTVRNITGQVIFNKLFNNTDQVNLDLWTVPGIYFIQLLTDSGIGETKKVMID